MDLKILRTALTHKIGNAGGKVGAYISDLLYLVFGFAAYLFPLCLVYLAWMIMQDYKIFKSINKSLLILRSMGFLMMLAGGCGLLHLEISLQNRFIIHSPGGYLGKYSFVLLHYALNIQGATLLLFAIFLVGVTWLTGLSWVYTTELIGYYFLLLLGIFSMDDNAGL